MFYYHLGDIACNMHLFGLYQWAMDKSVEHDEKINWWYWKIVEKIK